MPGASMTDLTIAISLNESTLLGMDDDDYIDVTTVAGEILPDVIAVSLCAGVVDDFDWMVRTLLGEHGVDSDNEVLYEKIIRYVGRCVNACRQYMPDKGTCEFKQAFVTPDMQIILIVKFTPHTES